MMDYTSISEYLNMWFSSKPQSTKQKEKTEKISQSCKELGTTIFNGRCFDILKAAENLHKVIGSYCPQFQGKSFARNNLIKLENDVQKEYEQECNGIKLKRRVDYLLNKVIFEIYFPAIASIACVGSDNNAL